MTRNGKKGGWFVEGLHEANASSAFIVFHLEYYGPNARLLGAIAPFLDFGTYFERVYANWT